MWVMVSVLLLFSYLLFSLLVGLLSGVGNVVIVVKLLFCIVVWNRLNLLWVVVLLCVNNRVCLFGCSVG